MLNIIWERSAEYVGEEASASMDRLESGNELYQKYWLV